MNVRIYGLRQLIQQIRNEEEVLQYELYKIAKIKGYCNPIEKATLQEIKAIKNEF